MQQPVVLLTGASGNLGKVMAAALISSGRRVVLTDRAQSMSILRRFDQNANSLLVEADLTSALDRERLIDEAQQRFGRIDALTNNAAFTSSSVWPDYGERPPILWEMDCSFFERMFEMNVNVPHHLVSAILPGMLDRGWGRIVNLSCNFWTMHHRIPYGPSKAALESYTFALAHSLEGSGVTANTLLPGGIVATDRTRKAGTARVSPDSVGLPAVWITSPSSDGFNGRRLNASQWGAHIRSIEEAQRNSTAAGWLT